MQMATEWSMNMFGSAISAMEAMAKWLDYCYTLQLFQFSGDH